jgi:hypothetical protein
MHNERRTVENRLIDHRDRLDLDPATRVRQRRHPNQRVGGLVVAEQGHPALLERRQVLYGDRAPKRSRSSRLSTLPDGVRGSVSTNSIDRGSL